MYFAIVAALMFVLPVLSVLCEAWLSHAPVSVPMVGEWFVFWSVGARLLLAGVRQVLQPGYTASVILGARSEDPPVLVLVRELGFANLAIGAVGIGAIHFPAWQLAGALAGAIFYALAGLNHAAQHKRNGHENLAMVSDLFVAAVLLAVCIDALIH